MPNLKSNDLCLNSKYTLSFPVYSRDHETAAMSELLGFFGDWYQFLAPSVRRALRHLTSDEHEFQQL